MLAITLCACNGEGGSASSSSAKPTASQGSAKSASAKASAASAKPTTAASAGPGASSSASAADPGDPPLKEVRSLDGRYSVLLLENAKTDDTTDPRGLSESGVVATRESSGYTDGKPMFGQSVQWMLFKDEPHARAMLATERPKKPEACAGAGELKNEEVNGPDGVTGYEVWDCTTKEGLTVTATRAVLVSRTLYIVRLTQYGTALSPKLAKKIFDSLQIDIETTKKLEAGGAGPAGSAVPSASAAPKAGH